MEFTFDISELRGLPGAERLAGLEGDALVRALREFFGDVARGAQVRVDGTLVTMSNPEPAPNEALEAQRLYEKAGQRAHRGEFQKAVGIYRRVLELDPTKHEARRDLAMVLVEMGETEDAKGLLLDVLKVSRSIVPPALLTLNDTLNGAAALFLDTSSRGATDFFSRYRSLPTARLARDVHELCASHKHEPGSEYDLVDEIANLLGCRNWYSWRTDPGEFPILERYEGDFPEGGVTDPEKLKQKNAAAVPLLIKALDRLDKMEEAAIKQLVMEAALAGQSGINFTDPTPGYSLKSLPGENLSGLEIMCILYSGLKRLNPSMPESEIGMDLSAEYRTAKELRTV